MLFFNILPLIKQNQQNLQGKYSNSLVRTIFNEANHQAFLLMPLDICVFLLTLNDQNIPIKCLKNNKTFNLFPLNLNFPLIIQTFSTKKVKLKG